MREVSHREALVAGGGIGLAWTGTKYGSAWLQTGSVRCADLVAPVSGRYRFEYGVVDGFGLTVVGDPASPGENVTFRLRNRTGEIRTTDIEYAYAL